MRQSRLSGPVEGVMGNHDSYSDSFQNLLTQANSWYPPERREGRSADFALRQAHPKTTLVRRQGAKRLLPEIDEIMRRIWNTCRLPAFKEQGGYGGV